MLKDSFKILEAIVQIVIIKAAEDPPYKGGHFESVELILLAWFGEEVPDHLTEARNHESSRHISRQALQQPESRIW
ncbi:hypothetical protein TNCV_1385631 [Trichonephila clavipes]|nr:hypothetical protein TNCV_1385631 [Trichonephila clavipes]